MIDYIKTIGSTLTAWLLIGGCFWFLNKLVDSLSDLNKAELPEGQLGIMVGGLVSILTMAATSIFQEAVTRSAAQRQQAAFATGLATPTPNGTTVTASSTPGGAATVTSSPSPTSTSSLCPICGTRVPGIGTVEHNPDGTHTLIDDAGG